ncbi:hypothetical protein N7447_010311 [Penicillium robsamsonii]|uniref:uncharacterized protein n=1 Tax=Penicillium robsamsonii TaxID=1792511 RepID=UPI0025499678|nr:uncharacterized protein N7447_010311 [Penicillium robsamsonii]KAJ5810795.1 hypothetical protein N7447_010311 [Penicillium robsamsonii]
MDHSRDPFPALMIQLARETSGTPSIQESDDSLDTIPSGSEYEASSSPSPEPLRQSTRSRRITDQAPSTPVRPTRVRFSLGKTSQKHLPAASPTVSSDTPASVITRNRQTDTDPVNAKGRLKNATPAKDCFQETSGGHPRLSTALDSMNANSSPNDSTPSLDSDCSSQNRESSFVPGFNMDPPKPSTFSTSHGSSSGYDKASTSINPTSELPTTSASPRTHSSPDEAPFGYSGYRSPLRDYVFSTPPDPSTHPPRDPDLDPYMDPHQPYGSAVMSGITPFEDLNVLPSTFMYPGETSDNSNWITDPMGVYTPEEFERIIASEQEVLREMGDPHVDPPHMFSWEEQRCMRRRLAPDVLAAEMKAAVDAIEAENAGDERLQPGYWNSIGPPQHYPTEADAPGSSLTQHPPAQLEPDEPAHTESSSAQATSPDLREASEVPSQTLQSVEETFQVSAVKRARDSSPETKTSTSDLSTTASARTSVSVQRRSISSRVKTTSPSATSTSTCRRSQNEPVTPAPASTPSRRSLRISRKAELGTPAPQVTVSSRRLRSADVNPSSSARKIGKGNATPDSWETAPIADKMMSQMKETTTMSWGVITATWNDNRPVQDNIMTWRAVSKRWGRIKEKIGVWPGFDEVLLENLREFDSELNNDGFLQIADLVSAELGWEIPAAVCQRRYEFLKESDKLNLKGKGKARK